MTKIVGNDFANSLQGSSGDDVIYGFDPDGTTGAPGSITARALPGTYNLPVFVTAAPGDYRHLYVVEIAGRIKKLDLVTGDTTVILDISSEISTAGEGGLLGLAFDPAFATSRKLYVDMTNLATDTEVREYQVSSSNPDSVVITSKVQVIKIQNPGGGAHKAGWIGFGKDGYLYVAQGDGGTGGVTSQDPAILNGKILRLDVGRDGFPSDDQKNYAIPPDNPFVETLGVLPEIWALGLRNPFRNGFDRATGTLYIADVGQNAFEEIDLGAAGANYGWRLREGFQPFETGSFGPGTLTEPIHVYDHSVGQAVIGGYVHRGESDGLQDQYWFMDINKKVFTLRQGSNGAWSATDRSSLMVTDDGAPLAPQLAGPASFGEDAAGNLYLVDLFGHRVYALAANVVSGDIGDVIDAGDGNDFAYGGPGNDIISGGSGGDSLYGGGGDDVLDGNVGNDVLFGGAGNDTLNGSFGSDALLGGGGSNTLNYASLAFSLTVNLAAGMTVKAGDGTDIFTNVATLVGSSADDTFVAGLGSYTLDGSGGSNTLDYTGASVGVNVDLLTGLVANNGYGARDAVSNFRNATATTSGSIMHAGPSGGILHATGNFDILTGQSSDTLIVVGSGNVLTAGSGSSTLNATGGSNTLKGAAGNDTLSVSGGASNVLDGGAGIDTLDYLGWSSPVILNLAAGQAFNAVGTDTLERIEAFHLGAGSDSVIGGPGSYAVDGGGGNNTIVYAGTTVNVNLLSGLVLNNGFDARDILVNFQNATVTSNGAMLQAGSAVGVLTLAGNFGTLTGQTSDTLQATGDWNVLIAGTGNSTLGTVGGYNKLNGGPGNDTLTTSGGHFNILDGGAGSSTLTATGDWNQLVAGDGGSLMAATGSWNTLLGGAGNDSLTTGSGGSNTLDGRGGNDTLSGGSGKATYVYGDGYGNDVITDFMAASEHFVDLQGVSSFHSTADVLSHTSQSGADVVIANDGATLTLQSTTLAWLTSHQEQLLV